MCVSVSVSVSVVWCVWDGAGRDRRNSGNREERKQTGGGRMKWIWFGDKLLP